MGKNKDSFIHSRTSKQTITLTGRNMISWDEINAAKY